MQHSYTILQLVTKSYLWLFLINRCIWLLLGVGIVDTIQIVLLLSLTSINTCSSSLSACPTLIVYISMSDPPWPLSHQNGSPCSWVFISSIIYLFIILSNSLAEKDYGIATNAENYGSSVSIHVCVFPYMMSFSICKIHLSWTLS